YNLDDQPVTSTETDASGATRTTSLGYDTAGRMTSRSISTDGVGHPAGWWKLDQTSGTSVADSSGNGNTAAATGVTWSDSAASFAAASGQGVATNGPVLDTSGSFTVSAWVKMTATVSDGSETAVGQDAGT